MTVLSDIFGIIIYCGMNAPNHVNNVVDGINDTEMFYLNEQMDPTTTGTEGFSLIYF